MLKLDAIRKRGAYCVCVCVCVCECVCVCVCVYCVHTCIYSCIIVCIDMHVCVCVCMCGEHTCVYVCMIVYKHMHVCVHAYVYMCVHMCTCVHACTGACMCVQKPLTLLWVADSFCQMSLSHFKVVVLEVAASFIIFFLLLFVDIQCVQVLVVMFPDIRNSASFACLGEGSVSRGPCGRHQLHWPGLRNPSATRHCASQLRHQDPRKFPFIFIALLLPYLPHPKTMLCFLSSLFFWGGGWGGCMWWGRGGYWNHSIYSRSMSMFHNSAEDGGYRCCIKWWCCISQPVPAFRRQLENVVTHCIVA